jgi:hypothetical protein
MTAVVQATCPHCRNVLRIPADWLDKPMRCKFCKNTFEARARVGDAPLSATPLPSTAMCAMPLQAMPLHAGPFGKAVAATAISASPPLHAADPFALEAEPFVQSPNLARGRRGSGSKIVVLGGCAVLLVAIVLPVVILAVVFGGNFLHDWAPTNLALADKDVEPPLGNADRPNHGDRPKKDLGKKGLTAKKDPPVKNSEKKLPRKDRTGKPIEKGAGLLPRRALLISVDNYLYLNSVHYGSVRSERYPGSSPAALAASLPNPPLRIPATQVFQLSDGGRVPHPTELSVLKNAIQDFLDTSRAQDRIVILFAGHGTEIDKDAYLIPISGRKEKAETLLPLAWVYEQMAKCKARQKVLILDLFRFPPALGFELPGAGVSEEGEMGEVFDKKLQEPPAGVQVWSSCIKDQRSIEFEGGSVFLQALNQTLQKGPAMTGFIEGSSPLPFDKVFVDKVNQHLKEQIGVEKLVQTSRLTGSPPADGAAYDPAEPLAQPITLRQPTMPSGGAASYAEINSILDELKMVPPTRKTRSGEDRLLQATTLPPFPEKVLATYRPDDYKSIDEMRKAYKNDPKNLTEKHPIRAAVLDAVEKLHESDKIVMRETLNGPINPKQKTAFLAEQSTPGIMLFELEKSLSEMRTVAESDMEKETSKRWRANFEYTQARLKARIVYIYEYSYLLGQIRQDALPPLDNGNDGWRVGSRKKIQVTEPVAKKYAKEVAKAWGAIQTNYPDTPWAVMAYRESMVTLGLEWRAKKE